MADPIDSNTCCMLPKTVNSLVITAQPTRIPHPSNFIISHRLHTESMNSRIKWELKNIPNFTIANMAGTTASSKAHDEPCQRTSTIY